MTRSELVFVPSPGLGHLVPTCKFAVNLLNLAEELCVTIIIIKLQPPFDAGIDEYVDSFSSRGDRIRFITLPQVEPPPLEEFTKSVENFLSLLISSYKPLAKDAIINNKWRDSSPKIVGLVIDMFCSSMIDVANELGIPPYIFFTSGAGFLGFVLYLSVWHSQHGREFSLSDPDLDLPAYADLVPSNVLPTFAFNKEGYAAFMNHGARFKETKGILINTFAELEPHAVNSLASDPQLPPVYTIGPHLDLAGQKGREDNKEEIMKWLEDQPPSSVLFLCFGSMGTLEVLQLQELANALEQSGVRFLWSIKMPLGSEYGKFDELLPEGFLIRTKDRGMVCGWAPQVHVLAHKATAGFVSHCGWNSTLESLWHGVPMVTWPLYGEQQMNAFQMVKDLELAVELRMDYRMENNSDGGIVRAEEIENVIRCIMDSENPVRKRVKEMRDKSREVLMESGSSFVSLRLLLKTILDGK
ncbi:PREDICTED: anthocyanidin 3-O-glucosyltransferase 2-like [Nicotiana attenuata]|uniref:Glycosyltransferase n=1 Tax=Nicotiana attenuata TaxID=49451 RepID=A0A1J6KZG8_NICAT|nr:PREDICTED: anthocyanidin 3-O-glucosyltransferase 2-like [Nicotiana attenuata]AQQ16688.1 UDP-glycosyltransferase g28046 [Nicotiana attenuata]OIT28067.1 udp-glucose flavonoid 3-o-glucosyltransferase 6 [Nicotiana attenuata]